MTGKQICEAWVRRQHPDLPAGDVEREALAFWNASPTGELGHVFAAGRILEEELGLTGEGT